MTETQRTLRGERTQILPSGHVVEHQRSVPAEGRRPSWVTTRSPARNIGTVFCTATPQLGSPFRISRSVSEGLSPALRPSARTVVCSCVMLTLGEYCTYPSADFSKTEWQPPRVPALHQRDDQAGPLRTRKEAQRLGASVPRCVV